VGDRSSGGGPQFDEEGRGGACLVLVDTVDGVWHLVDLLLGGIDHTADHDQLFGGVVLEDEGEGAIGLDHVLLLTTVRRLFELATTEDARVLLEHIVLGFVLFLLLVMTTAAHHALELFVLLFGLVASDGGDTLFGDLDGALVDELVQVHFVLATLTHVVVGFEFGIVLGGEGVATFVRAGVSLFLGFAIVVVDTLFAHSREVSPQGVEHIGDALFAERTTDVDLVLDLEFGQLNVDATMRVFVGLLQQFFQLNAILQVQFLHFGQTVLVLGHDGVEGHFALFRGQADDLDQFVFVVLESSFRFQHFDRLHLLRAQRVEFGGLGGETTTHLRSPRGLQLQTADQDHLGVVGDGVLREDLSDLVLGLLGHPLIDLTTALLRLLGEGAMGDGGTERGLDVSDELLLSASGLGDEQTGHDVDLGGALGLTSAVLSIDGSLEVADQRFYHLLADFERKRATDHATDLSFGVSASALDQTDQTELDGQRGDDDVLVVAFLFALLVQTGGQSDVGVVDLLEYGVARFAFVIFASQITTAFVRERRLLVFHIGVSAELLVVVVAHAGVSVVSSVFLVHIVVIFVVVVVFVAFFIVFVHTAEDSFEIAGALIAIEHTFATDLVDVVVDVVVQIVRTEHFAAVLTAHLHGAVTLAVLFALLVAIEQAIETVAVVEVGGVGHGQAESDQDQATHLFGYWYIPSSSG